MAISDSLHLTRKKSKKENSTDKVEVSISKQTDLFSKCLRLMSFLGVKLTKNICKSCKPALVEKFDHFRVEKKRNNLSFLGKEFLFKRRKSV